jgi:heme-degrading monooxygenase HmoA
MPFVMMNIFLVTVDKAKQFEARCRLPHQCLQSVPGLEDFQLLRGQTQDGKVPYVAHSIWSSQEALEAWKQSENFMQSRYLSRLPASMLLGRPRRECFEIVGPTGSEKLSGAFQE